jgi:hypothetical protein
MIAGLTGIAIANSKYKRMHVSVTPNISLATAAVVPGPLPQNREMGRPPALAGQALKHLNAL